MLQVAGDQIKESMSYDSQRSQQIFKKESLL